MLRFVESESSKMKETFGELYDFVIGTRFPRKWMEKAKPRKLKECMTPAQRVFLADFAKNYDILWCVKKDNEAEGALRYVQLARKESGLPVYCAVIRAGFPCIELYKHGDDFIEDSVLHFPFWEMGEALGTFDKIFQADMHQLTDSGMAGRGRPM